MNERPPVIFLMGPTASGKTAAAVELVREYPLEIVSVDSALVYRGMDIGTAKPGPEVLAVAPHRLIDLHDPAQPYSAARFRADALREICDIHAAGRVPLLTGGTMLYFRALAEGLSALPGADPEVRAELEREAERKGWPALHQRLGRVDPVTAARLHPNDAQRIQRALEVYRLSGRTLSALIGDRRPEPLPWPLVRWIVAPGDRALLHRRIAQRFDRMLAAGFVDEVRRLRARGDLHLDTPAMRAVGYRQVWEYLDGRCDTEAMRERGIAATRQFARRQLIWLRRERNAQWFDATGPDLLMRLRENVERMLQ